VAEQVDCRVALLPIKPKYVRSILDGEKTVEFRRKTFSSRVDYVVIYASSPVKKVVGYFRVGAVTRHSPDTIWQEYADCGGISEVEFRTYYSGAPEAVAIEVGELFILARPMSLCELSVPPRAPQNFRYVESSVLARLGHLQRQ
jgi:predicted transcriptional regulator